MAGIVHGGKFEQKMNELSSPNNIAATAKKFAELEKQHVFAALDRCKGNRTHAAKLLDVSIRTLRNKLHEYNGTSPKSGDDEAA